MGATLAWVKIVDVRRFRLEGGDKRLEPKMDNVVELTAEAPSEAAPFVVHRAWSHFDSAFTELWVIRDRHGRTLREGIEREVTAETASPQTGGGITDEVAGQIFEYADDGYQLVLHIDGREVARADFEVREPGQGATVS